MSNSRNQGNHSQIQYQQTQSCYPKPQSYYPQSQIYQQQQTQLTDEMLQNRYYIYQGLQFLLNLIYSYTAALEYFKHDPNNPMLKICLNKIILQLNLNNGITFDIEQSSKNIEDIKIQKENVKKIFITLIQELPQNIQQELYQYLNFYLKTMTGQTNFEQMNQVQTGVKSNFIEKVVQNIISGMQTTDYELSQIKQNKHYFIPDTAQLRRQANNYYHITKEKLKINFPQNQNLSNNNYYQQQQPERQNQHQNNQQQQLSDKKQIRPYSSGYSRNQQQNQQFQKQQQQPQYQEKLKNLAVSTIQTQPSNKAKQILCEDNQVQQPQSKFQSSYQQYQQKKGEYL